MEDRNGSAKVLFVDDSWYMHTLVTDLLTPAGYEVLLATTASQAVAAFEQERPDVVLMDIVLPRADGIEAMSDIRRIDPLARIIVVSGVADESVKLQALASGAAEFIAKPISAHHLLRAIRAALPQAVAPAHRLQTAT